MSSIAWVLEAASDGPTKATVTFRNTAFSFAYNDLDEHIRNLCRLRAIMYELDQRKQKEYD